MNNQAQTSQTTRPTPGRPRNPNRDEMLQRIFSGETAKQAAYEVGMTSQHVTTILSKLGIRKQYLTAAEFKQILNQRKAGGVA
jgi:hypothetical protein